MYVRVTDHVLEKLLSVTGMETSVLKRFLFYNAFVEVAKVQKKNTEMGVLIWDLKSNCSVFVVLLRRRNCWVAITAYVPRADKVWNGKRVLTEDNVQWAKSRCLQCP